MNNPNNAANNNSTQANNNALYCQDMPLMYNNCNSLLEMAALVLNNKSAGSHYVNAYTIDIVAAEFPVIYDNISLITADNFESILSEEEDLIIEKALDNIYTNYFGQPHSIKDVSDDVINLIFITACMLERITGYYPSF
jgi:hypothetical protein